MGRGDVVRWEDGDERNSLSEVDSMGGEELDSHTR